MKKVKFLKLSIAILGLFFAVSFGIVYAFDCKTVCQPPLTTFSNGSSTFDISFPPGGGTTCDTIADCPTVTIPDNATIFSMKVDMELTDPASEIGTPYIWVPTVNGFIEQVDTNDCSLVGIYPTGTNPSRTFVVPGGDVWVANRDSGNVTRLSPLMGSAPSGGTCGDSLCSLDENIYICPADCNGNICDTTADQDCRKYKVVGTYGTGGGPRGVTGDINGNVWVGNYSSGNISKLNSQDGTKLIPDIAIGGSPYGLVGDQYGHIWISNRGNGSLQCVNISNNSYTTPYPFVSGSTYGIGVDKHGNIYIANYGTGAVHKFDAITEAACPGSMSPSENFNTGTANGARGVAVDQEGNVWISNSGSNKFFVFTSPANSYSVSPGGTNILGAAVDANGFGWTVSYANNKLYKYEFTGSSLNLKCSKDLGGNPYNYSDMTGLRTVPQKITVDGTSVPLSTDGTFVIYSGVCVPAALSSCINPPGSISCGSESGLCEVPLEIFSMQAGDYTLKNLEVIYGEQIPITTGGLVPCGRADNNPATPWDDTDPCDFCHLLMLMSEIINFLIALAATITLLALVITGFLFITSAGNEERRTSAKRAFKMTLIGFIIIFMSWLMIDFLLSAWGYLDPLGGKWNIVCD